MATGWLPLPLPLCLWLAGWLPLWVVGVVGNGCGQRQQQWRSAAVADVGVAAAKQQQQWW